MSERHERRCALCGGRGYLPLDARARGALERGERPHAANGDWLECDDCGGTGRFVVYEHRVMPARVFLMPGLRP